MSSFFKIAQKGVEFALEDNVKGKPLALYDIN